MPSNSNGGDISLQELYEEFGIDRKFDHPSNISSENSYYQNGNYPPDWSDRREAVLEYQNGRCARCRTTLEHEDYYNCHHYRPVSEGGQHSLSNLVDLCADCHKLIHPDVDNLDGNWRQAPMFPHPDADPRMATVRRPVTDEEKQRFQPELSLAAERSPVGENEFANSDATIPVSPADALRMREDFRGLLEDMGLAERTELTVRAVNSEHSPLRNASVAVEFRASGTVLNGETDKYGEASFEVPSGIDVRASVSKDDFETVEFEVTAGSGEEYREITLEAIGRAGDAAAGAASASTGGESRRPVLKTLGLLGAGGIAGYFLKGGGGSTDPNSAPVNDASGGANTLTETGTGGQTATHVPVNGFEEVWSNTTETFGAVTHVASAGSTVYTATDSGLLRQLGDGGKVQWTQGTESPLLDIELFGDRLAVLTRDSVSLLDSSTGEEMWSIENSEYYETVNGGAGAVFAGEINDDGRITAFDSETGEQLWDLYDIYNISFMGVYDGKLYYGEGGSLRRVGEVSSSGEKNPEAIEETASLVMPSFKEDSPLGYSLREREDSYDESSLFLNAFDVERGTSSWEKQLPQSGYGVRQISTSQNVLAIAADGIWAGDESGTERWYHEPEENYSIERVAVESDRDQFFYSIRNDQMKIIGRNRANGNRTHSRTADGEIKTMSSFGEGVIVTYGDGSTRYITPN